MAKSKERIKARVLRRQGKSLNEIARLVKISKRTVIYWCHDIHLTKKQSLILWKKANLNRVKNFKKFCEFRRQQTQEKIKKIHKDGVKFVNSLNQREHLIAGIALYWAEGFKKGRQVGFSNSDPAMIKFFLYWLENCLQVPLKKVKARISLNISHQKRVTNIENYWSKITGLSKNQFNQPFYQKVKWQKAYENPQAYFGVLQLRINSVDLLRKIQGMILGLKKQTSTNIDLESQIS